MEEKKEIRVSLSNDGLSSYIDERHLAQIVVVKDGKGDLTVELKPQTQITRVLNEGKKEEFNAYIKRLYEVANRNNIKDTDKVFFTKGSAYPRTAFNRYSDKARRIESQEKAHKKVIGKFEYQAWSRYRTIQTPLGSKYLLASYNRGCDSSIFNNMSDSDIRKANGGRFKRIANIKQSAYHWNHDREIKDFLMTILVADGYSLLEDSIVIDYPNLTFKAQGEFLFSGPKISEIVTDESVARYIDGLKPRLDDENYKVIKTALAVGDTNITMGLKLLENMNLENSKPHLYALLIHAFANNGVYIKANNNWNAVAMKNVRKLYKIEDIFMEGGYRGYHNDSPVQKSPPTQVMQNINQVYATFLKKDEEKEEFRRLMKEDFHDNLKAIIGRGAYELLMKSHEDN